MHHFLLCNVRIPRFITLYLLIPKILYCYYIGNLSLFPPYSQITFGISLLYPFSRFHGILHKSAGNLFQKYCSSGK